MSLAPWKSLKIREMYDLGASIAEIKSECDVSAKTVDRHCGPKTRKPTSGNKVATGKTLSTGEIERIREAAAWNVTNVAASHETGISAYSVAKYRRGHSPNAHYCRGDIPGKPVRFNRGVKNNAYYSALMEMRDWRRQGYSCRAIADRFGVSWGFVRYQTKGETVTFTRKPPHTQPRTQCTLRKRIESPN